MAINITTTRSAILVLPQTQNFAGGEISGFGRKSFTRQNSPDSKVFGFKVPTLNSGKISGDITVVKLVLRQLNNELTQQTQRSSANSRGRSSVGRPIKGQGTPNRRGPHRFNNIKTITKPGIFFFGFVHLRVNGKTNPVLKHSGFVTNPEQLISSSVNLV